MFDYSQLVRLAQDILEELQLFREAFEFYVPVILYSIVFYILLKVGLRSIRGFKF